MKLKRIFDLLTSLVGLVALSPLLIIVSILIKTDNGPVFFRQIRVGYRGDTFHIFKFRSMVRNAERNGCLITAQHDPRITRVGRFLRKTKLDELPQLFNVLMGDMSLVGPRPEVPFYVTMWPENTRQMILSIKPGITDYATLFYRDEQVVLDSVHDVNLIYLKEILPHKLALYQRYVQDRNFWLDLRILAATLLKIVGARSDFLIPNMPSQICGRGSP